MPILRPLRDSRFSQTCRVPQRAGPTTPGTVHAVVLSESVGAPDAACALCKLSSSVRNAGACVLEDRIAGEPPRRPLRARAALIYRRELVPGRGWPASSPG